LVLIKREKYKFTINLVTANVPFEIESYTPDDASKHPSKINKAALKLQRGALVFSRIILVEISRRSRPMTCSKPT
jgi:hypothetical protein